LGLTQFPFRRCATQMFKVEKEKTC
jgi:hypothetical protein